MSQGGADGCRRVALPWVFYIAHFGAIVRWRLSRSFATPDSNLILHGVQNQVDSDLGGVLLQIPFAFD